MAGVHISTKHTKNKLDRSRWTVYELAIPHFCITSTRTVDWQRHKIIKKISHVNCWSIRKKLRQYLCMRKLLGALKIRDLNPMEAAILLTTKTISTNSGNRYHHVLLIMYTCFMEQSCKFNYGTSMTFSADVLGGF